MNIGERIRLRRKALGMQQQYIAKALNVSDKTFREMEKGRSTPDSEEVRILVSLLKTTPEYLLGMTDDPEPTGAAPVTMNRININGIQNSGENNGNVTVTQNTPSVTPTPARQTMTLDLPSITQFAVQLKEQGDKEKMQDAIDIFKSSIAVLERAVTAV